MAVGSDYLAKLRRAVRRSQSDEVDAELCDLIEECRRDLTSLGVQAACAEDESDPLVLGAVRCFVRWKFGLSNEDAEAESGGLYAAARRIAKEGRICSLAIELP